MGAEVVDALVIAARIDIQQLTAGERDVVAAVKNMGREFLKLNAAGVASPFRDIGRDLALAAGAFQRGEIALDGWHAALLRAQAGVNDLRARGIEPSKQQLLLLDKALDRSTAAIRRFAAAEVDAGQKGKGLGSGLEKVAKGEAGIGRLRSGLAQVAVTASGTSAAVGQVVQGLLILGGSGTVGLIALAATIAVVAKGYELLTGKTREAQKAREALNEAGRQRISRGGDEITQISKELAAAETIRAQQADIHLRDIRQELSIWEGIKAAVRDTAANRAKEAEQTRLVAQLAQELHRQTANQQLAQQRDIILGIQRVQAAEIQAAQRAAKARQALAQERPQTFTGGALISDQELAAFRENVRLQTRANAEDIQSARIRLGFAKSIVAETGEQQREKEREVKLAEQELQLAILAGRERLRSLRDEFTLAKQVAATRERQALPAAFDVGAQTDAVRAATQAELARLQVVMQSTQSVAQLVDAQRQYESLLRASLRTEREAADLIKQRADNAALVADAERQAAEQTAQSQRDIAAIRGDPTAELRFLQRRLELITQSGDQEIARLDQARSLAASQTAVTDDERRAQQKILDSLTAQIAARGEINDAQRQQLETAIEIAKIEARVGQFNQLIQAIDAVSESFGGLGETGSRVLNDLGNLAASIARKNPFAAIISGFNLIGGLFGGGGPSDADLASEVTRENTRALDKLRESFDQAIGTLGNLAREQARLASVRELVVPGTTLGNVTSTRLTEESAQAFRDELAKSGLTVEAWAERIQNLTGIDVLDDKGHLVATALDDVDTALRLAADAALKFDESVGGIARRLENEAVIFGDPGATQEQQRQAAIERARQVELDALQLSDAEEARVRAIDLSTREGREAFRKWNQEIAKRAKEQGLTAEELGKFTDVNELFDTLASSVGTVNDFDDAVKGASDRLSDLNLPAGFKRSALTFAASDFVPDFAKPTTIPTPQLPPLRGTDITPKGGDGAAQPAQTFTGPISLTVPAPPGMDPQVFARQLRDALMQFGLSQSGDSLQGNIR